MLPVDILHHVCLADTSLPRVSLVRPPRSLPVPPPPVWAQTVSFVWLRRLLWQSHATRREVGNSSSPQLLGVRDQALDNLLKLHVET